MRLSSEEREELERCELRLAHGVQQAGDALRKIQEGRLYRENYATFAEYCQARWGLSEVVVREIASDALKIRAQQAVEEHDNCIKEELRQKGLPLPDDPTAMSKLHWIFGAMRNNVWAEAVKRFGACATGDQVSAIRKEFEDKRRARAVAQGRAKEAAERERQATSQSMTVGTHRTSDRVITIHLGIEDLEWANRCAAERGISFSGYIRDLIWLDRQQAARRAS